MQLTYEQFVFMVCESLGLEPSAVTGETSFLNDLGIDSLTMANFIIKLERRYNIRINLANVWELRTIREAFELFSAACASPSSPDHKEGETSA